METSEAVIRACGQPSQIPRLSRLHIMMLHACCLSFQFVEEVKNPESGGISTELAKVSVFPPQWGF